MSDQSIQQLYWDRLSDLRAELKELRVLIYHARPRYRSPDGAKGSLEHLEIIEGHLDHAHAGLGVLEGQSTAGRDELLVGIARDLGMARRWIDGLYFALGKQAQNWAVGLGIWNVLVLAVVAIISLGVWWSDTLPFLSAGAAPDPNKWLLTRACILAGCGGSAGAAVDFGRVLFLVYPTRSFEVRRNLWCLFAPFVTFWLAVAGFLLTRAGLLTLGASAAMKSAMPSSAAVMAVGFLVGLVPTAIYHRFNQVVRAVFGTDELRAPQIGAPQLKVEQRRLSVQAVVTASAATRLVSVVANVITTDGSFPVAMQQGVRNQWSGEFAAPPQVAGRKVTVIIEARDEDGGSARSTPATVLLGGDSKEQTIRE